MSVRRPVLLALLGALCFTAGAAAQTPGSTAAASRPAPAPAVTGAVLQGLDKLVARVTEIEAPMDKEVRLGTLKIVVRQCVMSPPEAPPESSAFLEVTEQRPDEEARKVFSGWMFASSPALSALEHPIYDVWVVACSTTASAGASRSP